MDIFLLYKWKPGLLMRWLIYGAIGFKAFLLLDNSYLLICSTLFVLTEKNSLESSHSAVHQLYNSFRLLTEKLIMYFGKKKKTNER